MDRGALVLRVLAVLIGLRALTDVFKPLGAGSGLVFFGKLLTGTANLILAPLLGLYMLVYAVGIWNMRRFALPMGVAYAGLVIINIVMFPLLQGMPPGFSSGAYVAFGVVAIGTTSGAAWLLNARKASLR